jgi:outer membrane lipoprotein-sorting protein
MWTNKKTTKKILIIGVIVAMTAAIASPLYAQSAEQIIMKLEDNRIHETVKVEGKMIIEDRFGRKVSTFISYGRGAEESLIEFTSKAEQGQKILRTEDEIYLYYPDAEEIIRMQGAALRESVLGSDFSYEDMTGEKSLLDSFTPTLLGTETVNGHACYKVELEAKSRNVPYPKEIIWVDKELNVGWRVHKFSLSGKLLKEMDVLEIEQIKGKQIPVHMQMVDTMKKNSSTEIIFDDIQINVNLDPTLFSLEELTW